MNAPIPQPEMENFWRLSAAEQTLAIKQLARQGMSNGTIAAATRLSIEQISRILTGVEVTP